MIPVIHKLITIQFLIHKKVSNVVFDNDAKGCYDRIISGIALALQALHWHHTGITLVCIHHIGYSKNSLCLLGSLWAHLEHHGCTRYGVSDKSYSSTLEKLMYHIGQGSCSSSIRWALSNKLILAALGEEFNCIYLISIYGTIDTTRPGDSFVDNTTPGATTDNCNAKLIDKDVKELTGEEATLVA
jgi:hypothetical protein